ncbi:hypothetical protein FF021_09220 [Leptospira noguchii]|uniref:Uncharacterized protein n=1 Tax=Leptospira noguchii serovar Autumnalis str. ZUN142 TaxID=1085540 RepID=M6UDV0_9LEPT|nr:hypothetical protein LEP1GSC186_0937 [Leptospira noguchii serovar Autumnalis str. ZUN142]TQE76682.1 hypothetical protein FF021_09220 [Leptospira noguchii]
MKFLLKLKSSVKKSDVGTTTFYKKFICKIIVGTHNKSKLYPAGLLQTLKLLFRCIKRIL